ncbi:MAG: DNA-binding protein [Candidatus Binatia bacterium]
MQAKEITALALSITLCAASSSFAQGAMGGRPGRGGGLYNPKTVETVSGEVVSVEEIHGKGWGGGRGGGYGVHLILKSDQEEIAVHIGPSWYLDKHGLSIAPGNRIEVRGSRITFQGKPAIIAAEVKKGDQSLKLRDDDGLPAWRGQGRP